MLATATDGIVKQHGPELLSSGAVSAIGDGKIVDQILRLGDWILQNWDKIWAIVQTFFDRQEQLASITIWGRIPGWREPAVLAPRIQYRYRHRERYRWILPGILVRETKVFMAANADGAGPSLLVAT